MNIDSRRYPIGKAVYKPVAEITPADITGWINDISALPGQLREAVSGLSAAQLDTPYREGGWTVRQVIHHVPDSHANGYIRCKLALTEDTPTIKPYLEDRWAQLQDTFDTPIEVSLQMLDAIHTRWVTILRSLDDTAFRREYFHLEQQRTIPLLQMVQTYAWHGKHHTAHVMLVKSR